MTYGLFWGLNIIVDDDDDDNNKRPQKTSCLTNNSIFLLVNKNGDWVFCHLLEYFYQVKRVLGSASWCIIHQLTVVKS